MNEKKLIVVINKPVSEVFAFTINPKNTPKWIESMVTEQTNEWPTRLGTIYRNQDREGNWSEYIVTEFKENERFIFTKDDKNYSVRYIFTPIGENATELEYYEVVEKGNIDKPFTQEILNKLKDVMENEILNEGDEIVVDK